MTRLTALWTAFLGSYEVRFCRDHAMLLTVAAGVLALAYLVGSASQ